MFRKMVVGALERLGVRDLLLRGLSRMGYNLIRLEPDAPAGTEDVPDAACYQPNFSPWLIDRDFTEAFSLASPSTIVSVDRCYVLWTLGLQALTGPGDFVECGVYRGGTARLLAELVSRSRSGARLHLFDTFSGMPGTGQSDLHKEGDFNDTSLARVRRVVGHGTIVDYHPGLIPETFAGLKDLRVAFAHVDVDVYQSVRNCCDFLYPRLVPGGVIVFDDYGFLSCPGARRAVDDFFVSRPEHPLILPSGQAVVVRRPYA